MTMQLDCNKNLFAIHVLTKQIQERLLYEDFMNQESR